MAGVSNISMMMQAINGLTSGQSRLNDLTQQLSSGVRSTDLTTYTAYESRTIVSSRGLQEKADSYISAIKSVMPRLQVYENSLSAIENLIVSTASLIRGTSNAVAAADQGMEAQVSGTIDQVAYYLNQKVGERYIFSGTRYTTQPVGNIKGLVNPPAEAFPAVSPDLPPFDPGAPGTDARAHAKDVVAIDDDLKLTYGLTTTDPGIQNLVQGLRYAYAATQDAGNYETYMTQAQDFLKAALDGIRSMRAQVAGNVKILQETEKGQNSTISLLQTQIESIRNADITEVSLQINAFNTQLQASYAATSKLITLSILNYM